MKNLYKSLLTIILIIISATFVFADSFTFSSAIYSVSAGYGDFGLGYFPVATGFGYTKSDIALFPDLLHKASFNLSSRFFLSTSWIDSNYAYDTGRPRWNLKNNEVGNYNWLGGEYFQPEAYIEGSLSQGFGLNPFNDDKKHPQPLVNVTFGFNTTYIMALESLSASVNGSGFTFVDNNGNLLHPYGGYINSFPWLSGNRKSFNNYFYFGSSWNCYRPTGRSAYDGIYASLFIEFGPKWFGNMNEYGVMSNYYKINAYLEEKFTLHSTSQENGGNWVTIFLGHNNRFRYIGGDVVPKNQIPTDRFRGALSDSLWVEFQLPQFFVGDCFSYIQLGFDNNLYFGHVVNELDQKSVGAELTSAIYAYYHLRLFGFVKFEYKFGFNLFTGIWDTHPGFFQWATVTFNVTL